MLLHLISSDSFSRSLVFSNPIHIYMYIYIYIYVSIELIDCVPFSPSELKVILLIF